MEQFNCKYYRFASKYHQWHLHKSRRRGGGRGEERRVQMVWGEGLKMSRKQR